MIIFLSASSPPQKIILSFKPCETPKFLFLKFRKFILFISYFGTIFSQFGLPVTKLVLSKYILLSLLNELNEYKY